MPSWFGQAAASGYEGLTTFRELNTSPSSWRANVTRLPPHPEDGDEFTFRNFVKPSYPDTAVV